MSNAVLATEAAVRPRVEDEAARAQLGRVLASGDFDVPERARKFLSYVVEESLAGRADRIKAYSVALEVFGRDASFDPQADPVVRIEAGRVRRALERYYLTGGRFDPVVITIPKGGYAPLFEPRDPEPAAAIEPLPQESPVPAPSSQPPSKRVWLFAAALCVLMLPAAWADLDCAGRAPLSVPVCRDQQAGDRRPAIQHHHHGLEGGRPGRIRGFQLHEHDGRKASGLEHTARHG